MSLPEPDRLGPNPPQAPRGFGGKLRSATLDIGPLRRHRDFRLLFIGQSVTYLGSTVTYVAIPYQTYHLTHSSLVVGLLGVVELVPLVTTALIGGAMADAFDRRRMVLLTEVAFALLSAVLLANVALGQVWLLFVVAGVAAALDGLQRPSLDALVPRLVDRDEVPAAAALSSLRYTVGGVAGPALGGLLIAGIGLGSTYAVDLVTFVVSLIALGLMRAVPPPPEAAAPSLRRIREGWDYARSRQVILGTYAVDIVAMFFGMPDALFPAAATHLGGPGVLGLLYAAPAAGSLIVTATSGWTSRVRRHGRAVCVAAVFWGVGILVFGVSDSLWLALVGLVFAGGADMVSGLFRMTIWNQSIPDNLRGRLAGIEQVSYSTGPLLGNVESGAVAGLTSVRFSLVSGGLACIVGVVVTAIAMPALWRYRAPIPESTDAIGVE